MHFEGAVGLGLETRRHQPEDQVSDDGGVGKLGQPVMVLHRAVSCHNDMNDIVVSQ
jgi:hypothetical protein